MFQPVIKWTGSKRTQAEKILQYFPKNIDAYYEPFLGGGSIMRALLEDKSIEVKQYICGDINEDLINMWRLIQNNPLQLIHAYTYHWNILNKMDTIKEQKEYFLVVRERYNEYHNPEDLFFIMRTVVNGMPRYNRKGQFNSTFHLTRGGMNPDRLSKIILEWNEKIQNVIFISQPYNNVVSSKNDFLYLDPPYYHTTGMYYGGIDYNKFFRWMELQEGNYVLSFDGKISNKEDMTYEVPKHLYNNHVYLKAGNSSFRRINRTSNDSIIYESLYIK